MLKIYHNTRCAKSRAGFQYLQQKTTDFETIEYLKLGLTATDIKRLVQLTGLKVTYLVRTQEDYYKQNLKGKTFSDEEWYQIIADNPKLLQRPIVIKDDKGVLAQPPENIDELL